MNIYRAPAEWLANGRGRGEEKAAARGRAHSVCRIHLENRRRPPTDVFRHRVECNNLLYIIISTLYVGTTTAVVQWYIGMWRAAAAVLPYRWYLISYIFWNTVSWRRESVIRFDGFIFNPYSIVAMVPWQQCGLRTPQSRRSLLDFLSLYRRLGWFETLRETTYQQCRCHNRVNVFEINYIWPRAFNHILSTFLMSMV